MAAVALKVGGAAVPDRSFRWSLAGHGLLLLLVLIGGLTIPRSPPPSQLAIKATVVDPDALRRPSPKAKPQPEPRPQPKPEAKPEAKPEPKLEPKREERQVEQQQEQLQKERRQQELKEKERANNQRAEKQREEKAAAERAKAEAERLQVEKLKAARLREEAAQREIARQLEAEEQLLAATDSGALADYVAVIRQKVERNWVRPPGARAGIECEVSVTQIPGGQVTSVRTERCNADEPVRRSIEAAVLRASPLPLPGDATLFERNLRFTFKPEQ